MKIIIADDHDLVTDALEALIKKEDFDADILKAKDVNSATEKLTAHTDSDLLLLDYNMPGMNAGKAVDKILKRFPSVRIVIMSGHISRDEIDRTLEYGASGFIPKTMSGIALVNAIKLVIAGEKYIHPSVYDKKSAFDNDTLDLTPRELDTLKQLFLGISNKEIASSLSISEPTVKLHLRSLCDKFEANNRTDLIIKAIKLGYGDV